MREPNESETVYMRRRFKEAQSEEALDPIEDKLGEEGYKIETVRARKSERRQELKKETRALQVREGTAKAGPLDIAVEKLRVPMVPEQFNGKANIYWAGFNEGVGYGVNTILAGIRSAQELSSVGIAQAKPVIEMAKEMRQAEGQAAQQLAVQLREVIMQGDTNIVSAIRGLAASQGQPAEVNPMMKVMIDTMQPHLAQTMQQLFSGIFKAVPQPGTQQPATQQPGMQQQAPQPQPEAWTPPNITDRSIEEYEEGN